MNIDNNDNIGIFLYENLKECSIKGKLNVLKYLVEHCNANIHTEDDYILRRAVYEGHLNIVEYLLENGANVHANDDEVIKWKFHINITNKCEHNISPLFVLLLKYGGDISKINTEKNDYIINYLSDNIDNIFDKNNPKELEYMINLQKYLLEVL